MYNSEFEKKVQEKLDELGFTPSTSVWDAVEAGLPRKGKRRGWWWLGILLLTSITGAVVVYQKNKPAVNHTAAANVTVPAASVSQTPAATAIITHNTANNKAQPAPRTTTTVTTNPAASIQIQTATSQVPGNITAPAPHKKSSSIVKSQRVKYTIASPGIAGINTSAPGIDAEENITTEANDAIQSLPVPPTATARLITSRNALPLSGLQKKPAYDTLPLPAKNTTTQKPGKKPWQMAVSFSAGASSVANGLFGGAKAMPLDALAGGGTGSPVTPALRYSVPVRHPGLSFGLGLHLQKLIRSGTRAGIGLRYGYYSGKIAVGTKVDSLVQFNQGGISFNSGAYYRPGSAGSYTNRFHYIELPITLRFALSRSQSRYPLFIEGGLTAGYLIQSNTLIQRSNGTFFTNRNAQNQLSLAATTGMGLSFGRFNQPGVLLGARLSCAFISSTKQKIDKQNILSSQLYVQMPVKNITRLVQRRK